ncbi:GrpB family protein [Ornithinimicrobium cryptoxanthini]|uniref:GrpB family protein n=1 Tax=Ornithinimicrobium cryptoxanthini TaxID=2934161 RepID=A0ABY4YGZ5_9MICO|nr:GrpB family protein [Ornithinimicrobium cryptoxanthini]USQ76046.1 GrpB family protein [Ornithinimicrobium cryptoxanthini]
MQTDSHYPAERLVAYDVDWPSRYRTSVPGLVAKPVVDLALRIPASQSLGQAKEAFGWAGWTTPVSVGDHWATFLLGDGVRTGIGHIFTADQWDKAHVRLFARWLREHPVERDRYARLKIDLVGRGLWGADYTAAKTGFVREIVNLARADRGLPLLTNL